MPYTGPTARRGLHETREEVVSQKRNESYNQSQSSGEDSTDHEGSETEDSDNQYNSNTANSEDLYEYNRGCNTPTISEKVWRRSELRGDFSEESFVNNSPSCTRGNKNSKISWIVISLVIVLASYFAYGIIVEDAKSTKTCHFNLLEKEFPMEDELLWKSLRVGIEGILNNRTNYPAVYLFLHPEGAVPRKLIWDIAKTASACFNPSLKPVEFGSKDFTSEQTIQDYGIVIEKYAAKVKDGGTLVVANLNEIPGKSARALHAICDTYSPIVRNVVIFMTLVTSAEQGNPTEIAENILHNLWKSSMGRNELDPLIARVTDQVFKLESK